MEGSPAGRMLGISGCCRVTAVWRLRRLRPLTTHLLVGRCRAPRPVRNTLSGVRSLQCYYYVAHLATELGGLAVGRLRTHLPIGRCRGPRPGRSSTPCAGGSRCRLWRQGQETADDSECQPQLPSPEALPVQGLAKQCETEMEKTGAPTSLLPPTAGVISSSKLASLQHDLRATTR